MALVGSCLVLDDNLRRLAHRAGIDALVIVDELADEEGLGVHYHLLLLLHVIGHVEGRWVHALVTRVVQAGGLRVQWVIVVEG